MHSVQRVRRVVCALVVLVVGVATPLTATAAPGGKGSTATPVPPATLAAPAKPRDPAKSDASPTSKPAAELTSNPNALTPVDPGDDSYDQPISGNAKRAEAPPATGIGKEYAYVRDTSLDTHVMVGGGSAEGQAGMPSGSGIAAEAELFVVSKQKTAFSVGATYLKMLDADRRLVTAVVRVGYRLLGKVHGSFMGFTPRDILVRATRSSLFFMGSMTFVNVGKYTYKDADGYQWNQPDDSVYPGLGLTFERRRASSTVILSGDGLREIVHGAWGFRSRLVFRMSRYSAGLTYSKIDGVQQQARLTVGLVF